MRFTTFIFLIFIISNTFSQHYFFGDIQTNYSLDKYYYSTGNHHTLSKPYLISKFKNDFFQKGLWKFGSMKDSSSLVVLPFVSLSQVPALYSTKLNYDAGLQINYSNSRFFSQLRFGYQTNYFNSLFQNLSYKRLMSPNIGYLLDSTNQLSSNPILQGLLSYKLNKYMVVSVGSQKNKFGDGYRSLWLSEFAPVYPFLKLESTFWKVKYVNLWSMHDDRHSKGFSNKKWVSSHMLSFNVTKWLNLSLFESVIWQDKDTLINRGPEINYFNPFVFFRPVEYGIGSADNSLVGAGLRWNLSRKIISYSSIILDEFLLSELRNNTKWWGNKFGVQFGIKLFDLFHKEGLYSILEYNLVRPYTYSHISSKQNYGHKNHSLVHPLESNFKEFLILMGYQKNNIDFTFQFHSQLFGLDSAGINFGGNMFNSYVDRNGDYDQSIGQGNTIRQNIFILQISYLLAARTNSKIFFRFNFRKIEENNNSNTKTVFNFGLSSRLWQNLQDF